MRPSGRRRGMSENRVHATARDRIAVTQGGHPAAGAVEVDGGLGCPADIDEMVFAVGRAANDGVQRACDRVIETNASISLLPDVVQATPSARFPSWSTRVKSMPDRIRAPSRTASGKKLRSIESFAPCGHPWRHRPLPTQPAALRWMGQ